MGLITVLNALATLEVPITYSSIRFHPITKARNSPTVTYVYT